MLCLLFLIPVIILLFYYNYDYDYYDEIWLTCVCKRCGGFRLSFNFLNNKQEQNYDVGKRKIVDKTKYII